MASGRGSVDSAGDRKSPQQSALLVRTYSAPVLSELLVRQGRVVDAEIVARENLFKQARGFGRNSGQTLEGLTAPAQILSARGRLDDTALLTDAALEIFDHIGAKRASSTRAITRLTLAEAYIGNDNWTDAVTTFDAISRDLAGNPDSYGRVLAANPVWAMVLLRQGRPAKPSNG